MLRDEFQVALQELEDVTRELLQRLENFDAAGLDPDLRHKLEARLDERRGLLERLAELSRQRDDLPGEGNLELAQFTSVIDQLMEQAGALRRLARDEQAFATRIGQLDEMNWHDHERATLRELAANAEAIALLLEDEAVRRESS